MTFYNFNDASVGLIALFLFFYYDAMPCIHAMELYIVNYNIGMADIFGGGGMLLLRLRRSWVG